MHTGSQLGAVGAAPNSVTRLFAFNFFFRQIAALLTSNYNYQRLPLESRFVFALNVLDRTSHAELKSLLKFCVY